MSTGPAPTGSGSGSNSGSSPNLVTPLATSDAHNRQATTTSSPVSSVALIREENKGKDALKPNSEAETAAQLTAALLAGHCEIAVDEDL